MRDVRDRDLPQDPAADPREAVAEALLAADGAFVSGEALSRRTGVSRTAIWKHVKALEAQGFVIESVPRLGHRLKSAPDEARPLLVRRYLAPGIVLGRAGVWVDEIDSTNRLANAYAQSGAPHGFFVAAGRQTGGRGRRGRAWFSPAGGLWFSLVLTRPLPLRRAPELTLLASVAVRRAIAKSAQVAPDIKWPNDLLLHGRKLCGILAEIRAEGEMVERAVIGIGINVNIPGEAFPEDLVVRATSLLAETGRTISLPALCAEVCNAFDPLYHRLVEHGEGFARVMDEWTASCATLGQWVRVDTPRGVLEGQASSVDETGALELILADGQRVRVHTGEELFSD
ncbi:biotin--[acetyl-CoA-carboxylase] ligase [Alicyclobacillus sp.]|uniref:biotin--[acetyl-CoA-carboxylase] ligase n=1 Tax=Alicyclobacillus sp. TaxID=61169 RepID=UPI0025BE23C2|nr:biotin--[acetyl-CoA-carboxylase] ligase [Alicyclobacillus sp.]MCL6515527.1 biotin--[acetyl-CoA-carboxylase] ligase [Alicyclobacillus sp.]